MPKTPDDVIDAEFVTISDERGNKSKVKLQRLEDMSKNDLMPLGEALGNAQNYIVKYLDQNPPAKMAVELGGLALLSLGMYVIFKLTNKEE